MPQRVQRAAPRGPAEDRGSITQKPRSLFRKSHRRWLVGLRDWGLSGKKHRGVCAKCPRPTVFLPGSASVARGARRGEGGLRTRVAGWLAEAVTAAVG